MTIIDHPLHVECERKRQPQPLTAVDFLIKVQDAWLGSRHDTNDLIEAWCVHHPWERPPTSINHGYKYDARGHSLWIAYGTSGPISLLQCSPYSPL